MSRRSLPMYNVYQDLEDGDPRVLCYNSPRNGNFVRDPSLRLARRLQPVEQLSMQDVEFSYNPLNHGYGRGRILPHQIVLPARRPGYDSMFEYDNAVVGDNRGYYSPYGSAGYRDNRILVNGTNLPVNRRLSTGPGYLVAEKHSMLEFREYTKEEKHKISEKLERLCNRVNPGKFEDDFLNKSGLCENCGILTTRYCQRCNVWYCSRDCQLEDWPRHKMQCISIPELGDFSEEPSTRGKEQTTHMKTKQRFPSQNHEKEGSRPNSPQEFHLPQTEIDSRQHTAKVNRNFPQKHEKNGNDGKQNYATKTNRNFTRKHDEQNENCGRHHTSKTNHYIPQSNGQAENQRQNYLSKSNSFDVNRPKPNFNKSGRLFAKENHNKENSYDDGHSVNFYDGDKKVTTYSPEAPISTEVKENDGRCEHGNPTLKSNLVVKQESSFTKDFEVTESPTPKAENTPKDDDKAENSFASKLSKYSIADVKNVSLKSIDLPKDSFTKVKVSVPVGKMECWVQLEDSSKLLEVMGVLNEDSGKSPIKKLEQGMMCAALYEGLWFRGKITHTEPELKVLYIDYGNEECCTSDQLKPVPAAVENIPALAVKIKLAEGTSKKYEVLSEDQVLSVKCVDISGDAIVVQVEGEIYPEKKNETPKNTKVSANTSKLNSTREESESSKHNVSEAFGSAFLNVKIGRKGGCEFRQHFGEDNYGVTIVYPELKEEFAKLFANLILLKSIPCSDGHRPDIGEIVAAFVEGGSADGTGAWMRARILATDGSSYQVNLCDHCHVTSVDTVRRLPQELASIPEFGARCRILDKLDPEVKKSLFDRRRFFLTVFDVDLKQKKVICLLHSENDEGICKVELTEWVPVLEEKSYPELVSLKNNDKVVLTVFFNLNSLCLQSLSLCKENVLSKLEADLSRHCSSAPNVNDIPAKNEIVACKFLADGKYYRAQVVSVERDQIKVLYIDYGNMDCVTKSAIKLLPEDLKKIPGFVVKVGLKNIASSQMTKQTVDLLTGLIQNATEMKVIMSGPLENGVELILPDGKKLNDEINKTLTPQITKRSPEKKVEENKILTERDIKYLELPVGKSVDFLVLHKMDNESLMGCEANGEVMAKVHGAMSEKMNRYCESTSEKLYIPEVSELCFAKYEDGLWYRAMCISKESTRENNILFLDFGNMAAVDYANIRKMTPEFIEMPAIAVLCTIQVPAEVAAEAKKIQLDELVKVNNLYRAHIVSCDGLGSYVIEFPHVTEALKKLKK